MKLPDKIGINEYSINLFYINANLNKLEQVYNEKGNYIVCGSQIKYSTKKKKAKKK